MERILSSKVFIKASAIILIIAMVIALVPVSIRMQAEEMKNRTNDIALEAMASASGERPEWGILATNLNNGHVPTSSSSPAGSWHDYGLSSEDGTSWVQYDWVKDVTIDAMSIYWMSDGAWANRIPVSMTLQYKDENDEWQTAAEYDSDVMAAQLPDQYNLLEFDSEITTKVLRMIMVRNPADNFCSIHRWQVWGNWTPENIALAATASGSTDYVNDGGGLAALNNNIDPINSHVTPNDFWHNWNHKDIDAYVQYDWNADATISKTGIYVFSDGGGIPKPSEISVSYYDSEIGDWVEVKTIAGDEIVIDQFNEISFEESIVTRQLKLDFTPQSPANGVGIKEWQVWGILAEPDLGEEARITSIPGGYRMENSHFYIETGAYGQITTLRIQNDEFPTNYVMNANNARQQDTPAHQWFGELMFSVKVGDQQNYSEQYTSRSDDVRNIELIDNKIVITYEDSQNEKAIKDFKVVETYSLVGDKLRWEIEVFNTNDETLTVGDFGLPLPFNEIWPGGEEIYETRVLDHSFVGKDSSYIYITRPSGIGRFLLMTPDVSTGAGFEYQDHWRTVERAADERAWCQDQNGWANGLNVFYIHSDYIKKTNRGYLENTKLELAPAESKLYAFNFSVAMDEADMKSTLYEENILDTVSVPGMTYSINMPGKLYLHTPISKDDISFDIECPHENGLHAGNPNTISNNLPCNKTDENTYVRYDKTVTHNGEQYHIYDVKFGDLGHNNVIVNYIVEGAPKQTVLQFYMMDDVATALDLHSDFMVEHTQWDLPGQVGDKVFDDWMMNTKNKRGETDPTYWKKNYWGWGDDWGLTHGQFLAEKNVYLPVSDQIKAVDEYLDIAIWNNLMREHHKDYLVHNFLMIAPNASPTYRGYAYPHIYNTYFSMYKIASKYPDMIEYEEEATTYLLRAYGIFDALYNGKGVAYNWHTGLMGELTTPDIIAALEKEGFYAQADNIRVMMDGKYNNFKNTKYPYGSEYTFDNTGEESVYTLAKMQSDTDTENAYRIMSRINLKTRACRGLEPIWYHYASPVTICGENWWQFQYTAALAGYTMDDWLRVQDNGWTSTERAEASRVNYAAKLANITCINSGQIDADPANLGSISWTYQAEMGNLGGQGTGGGDLHNGWRQMAGEADLGLFGALMILSSDVVVDPVFGLFGYGCEVTEIDEIYTVKPLDGLFTRLNFINQELYIELDRDQYTEAKVAKDNTSIELTVKNLEQTAHTTDAEIRGLLPGSYQVFVNGILTSSFQAVTGETSRIRMPLPAAATANVEIKAGPALDNVAPVIIMEDEMTVAISDKARLEADATDDGYVNSTLTYQWELVSSPENSIVNISTPQRHITDVTFDKVGQYVFRFTADDGELSSAKEMAVTVEPNSELPDVLVDLDFEVIHGFRKFHVSSNQGSIDAYVDINSKLSSDGKDGKGMNYTGRIAGGYVELPAIVTKNLTEATVSIDVKLSGNQLNKTTIFEFGSNLVVEFVDGNEVSMTVNGQTAKSGMLFASGFWKNIAMTADGDNYALYIDGLKKAELTATGLVMSEIDTAQERYLIGRSSVESNPFLEGIVDNFVVKSYVMSDEEIQNEFGSTEERTIIDGIGGSVITSVGNAPVLPVQISVLYSDGVYEQGSVTWENIASIKYQNTGTFDVKGIIDGTDIEVSLRVLVVSGTLSNVAASATPSAIIDSPQDLGGVAGLNDGYEPAHSRDTSRGVWHNWLGGNQGGEAWIQYNWENPHIIDSMDIYFFRDGGGNFAPASYRIEYLSETTGAWHSVQGAEGLGVALNQYNHTSFEAIITRAIRVIMTPATLGCGVIEWKVYSYGEADFKDPTDPDPTDPKPTDPKPTEPTKPTDPAKPSPDPVKPQPEEVIEKELTVENKTQTKVTAKADENAFEEAVIIEIIQVDKASDEGIAALEKIMTLVEDFDQVLLFDINALTESGRIKVQPATGTKVIITMELPAGMDPERIAIVHIKDDGTVELLECEVKNGEIIFEVDSFSIFGVVELAAETETKETDTKDTAIGESDNELPRMGEDGIPAKVSIILILAILGLIGGFRIYMKRKEKGI